MGSALRAGRRLGFCRNRGRESERERCTDREREAGSCVRSSAGVSFPGDGVRRETVGEDYIEPYGWVPVVGNEQGTGRKVVERETRGKEGGGEVLGRVASGGRGAHGSGSARAGRDEKLLPPEPKKATRVR